MFLYFLASLPASFLILAFFYRSAINRAYKGKNVSPTSSPKYRVFFTFLFVYYPLLVIVMTVVLTMTLG